MGVAWEGTGIGIASAVPFLLGENMKKTEIGRKKILNFIKNYLVQYGYAPSYREIMYGTGYSSTCSVNRLVTSMVKEGMLESDTDNGDGKLSPRAVRVPGQSVTFWMHPAECPPEPYHMYELIFKIVEHTYQCHAYTDGSDWYAMAQTFLPNYDPRQNRKIEGCIAIAYAEIPRKGER